MSQNYKSEDYYPSEGFFTLINTKCLKKGADINVSSSFYCRDLLAVALLSGKFDLNCRTRYRNHGYYYEHNKIIVNSPVHNFEGFEVFLNRLETSLGVCKDNRSTVDHIDIKFQREREAKSSLLITVSQYWLCSILRLSTLTLILKILYEANSTFIKELINLDIDLWNERIADYFVSKYEGTYPDWICDEEGEVCVDIVKDHITFKRVMDITMDPSRYRDSFATELELYNGLLKDGDDYDIYSIVEREGLMDTILTDSFKRRLGKHTNFRLV
jgi:hypothetical protein